MTNPTRNFRFCYCINADKQDCAWPYALCKGCYETNKDAEDKRDKEEKKDHHTERGNLRKGARQGVVEEDEGVCRHATKDFKTQDIRPFWP